MKNIALTLATTLALLILSSCKEDAKSLSLSYNTTQCSDGWWPDCPDTDYESCFRSFWLARDVEIVTFTRTVRTDTGPAACLACQCSDGQLVTVEVAPEYVAALEELGFSR